MMSQLPFIPLGPLPREAKAPTLLNKGDILDWSPTEDDLDTFISMLMRWLDPGDNSVRFQKFAVFVCGSDIPYATTVQEIRTGVKLQQICIGNLTKPISSTVSLADAKRYPAGTIGRMMKYTHIFDDLDLFTIDSSRDTKQVTVETDTYHMQNLEGFALLKFWQDNWKATASSHYISTPPFASMEDGNANLLVGPVVGLPLPGEDDQIYLPVLLELDRNASLTFTCRNIFEGRDRTWIEVFHANYPRVIKIGPLSKENRYIFRIISGIRSTTSLSLSTHTSSTDTNVIILNCDRVENENKISSDFVYDIVKRNRIPFNGIALNIHLNCYIPLRSAVESLLFLPDLKNQLEESKKVRCVTHGLSSLLDQIFLCFQEEFRLYFSRPSYAMLLKTGYHLILPKRGEYLVRRSELDGQVSSTELFLWLAAERITQEYCTQLWQGGDGVYSCGSYEKNWEGLGDQEDEIEDYTEDEKNNRIGEVVSEAITTDRAKAVFAQWMKFSRPSTKIKAHTYISTNCLLSFIPEMTVNNNHEMFDIIENCPLELGNRILLVYPENSFDDVAIPYKDYDDNARTVIEKLKGWIQDRADRSISLIIPTTLHGTTRLSSFEGEFEDNLNVSLIDSVYKNNEYSRIARFREQEAIMKNEQGKQKSIGGKSKRAMEKKKEEERIAAEAIQKANDDFINALGPDGYLIIENRQESLKPPPPNDVLITIASVSSKIMGSIEGGLAAEEEIYKNIDSVRPSPLQYIQTPLWLKRFSPGNNNGIFFHDEVTLVMRQDPGIALLTFLLLFFYFLFSFVFLFFFVLSLSISLSCSIYILPILFLNFAQPIRYSSCTRHNRR